MASRIDDQLLKLRLRLLQEVCLHQPVEIFFSVLHQSSNISRVQKLSAIEQQDSARSRSRPSSKGSGSSATRLLLENAQRRRSELERRLQVRFECCVVILRFVRIVTVVLFLNPQKHDCTAQEERLARERALARPPAPQYVPLMLPPVESKRSPGTQYIN